MPLKKLKKRLFIPVLFGLCSCVTQEGVLQLDTGKLVLSPTGEMSRVMDTVPSTTHASTDTPLDMVEQLRRDFTANDLYYHECMVAPKKCDVTRISAPNSPQRADLTRRVRDFSVANIHARTGSGVALIRIDSLTIIDANNAMVNTCSYNSIVMVDGGATDSPVDDIIFNNTVASYLSVWMLTLDNGVWKIYSWTTSMTKFNVDQCGFPKP
ncbi:MAG: hypothetical protein O3A54_02610 [Actinobacteria bacterium]|nr:hypothetical protein [Actinomycetota bacterium]